MRALLPHPSGDVDLDALYAYPADRPWLRANMVASLDGAAAADGLSAGLSGPGDRRVFGMLRGLADCVLVGARTARAEGYRAPSPKPAYAERRAAAGQLPAPHLALVSGRLDLDPGGPMFGGPPRTLVLTCEASPADRRLALAAVADVVLAGETAVDPGLAVAALHERGLTRVLCEGGPTLLGQLAARDLIDELDLTVSPQLRGGPAPRIVHGQDLHVGLQLTLLLEEDGFLFTRWVRA